MSAAMVALPAQRPRQYIVSMAIGRTPFTVAAFDGFPSFLFDKRGPVVPGSHPRTGCIPRDHSQASSAKKNRKRADALRRLATGQHPHRGRHPVQDRVGVVFPSVVTLTRHGLHQDVVANP
jgi:hypothetical protein